MRLIRLKVRNIASLKGEHQVDFEAIQAQSSLFAITGETGAGKSSILNSIGLALYGQIYKKNVTQVDVVTLGERDGEIELIFQVAHQFYLAEWKAKVRKQDGTPLKQPLIQRQVFPIQEKTFGAIRGEPIESTERLLNLDFEQFCKCIILNQGEFARFLSSSFTERKEILEKLYPGELLDNIGQELKAQLDSLSREKSNLDIRLGELKSGPVDGEALRREKLRLKEEMDLHESWFKRVELLEFHFIALCSAFTKYHDNKRKSDHIQKELAEATTLHNQVLKDSHAVHENFLALKARQEKEMPRLQELLKVEEALKHAEESHLQLERKAVQLRAQFEATQKLKEQNQLGLEEWSLSQEKILSTFSFGIEAMKANKERLPRIFDLSAELTHQEKEQKGQQEKLQELETQGKEQNLRLTSLTEKLTTFPEGLSLTIEDLGKQKKDLLHLTELRQKSEIKSQELAKQLEHHSQDISQLTIRQSEVRAQLTTYEQEQLSLSTMLNLQEVTSAVEVCLTHADSSRAQACPVCSSAVPEGLWTRLLHDLKKADTGKLKQRSAELERLIIQLQEEDKHASLQKIRVEEALKAKETELALLAETLRSPLPSLSELELLTESLKKQSWELEAGRLEETRLKGELARLREAYLKAKAHHQGLTEGILKREQELKQEALASAGLVTLPLTPSIIQSLKENLLLLQELFRIETKGEKLKQEQGFIQTNQATQARDKELLDQEREVCLRNLEGLKLRLQSELGDKKALELIEVLNREVKDLTERWSKSEKELKQHELILKDHQSRLYTLDEQLKEYDLIFVKELHTIKEAATLPLPPIKEDLSLLTARLKELALGFSDPVELFLPFKDLLTYGKEALKLEGHAIREAHAGINQQLLDWEKRQDKIQLLELTRSEVTEGLNRRLRLFEVLGKDELRSFVLSLVEENLIIQTNEELHKLCQGRYEIIHQSRGLRMTPEFYIMDKFRGGGRRKVSTLSGGETFMVSLAMALALAEMTRGQAEIDSLFIDEGFGTLDQESLEDVLDMLNQIQTRGLLVGLISHIKSLTNAIAVNLVLTKRQDGTSTISLQSN